MQKKLYKLNVIKEYVPAGENGGYSGRNIQGLYFSHNGIDETDSTSGFPIFIREKPAPTEIYINLYDVASIEICKREVDDRGRKEKIVGYIVKMSTGIYLIPEEDGKKIIELLGCIN